MGATLPLLLKDNAPLGQKGQRGAVLVQLKRAQRLTAKELEVGHAGLFRKQSLGAVHFLQHPDQAPVQPGEIGSAASRRDSACTSNLWIEEA